VQMPVDAKADAVAGRPLRRPFGRSGGNHLARRDSLPLAGRARVGVAARV
jgi:hypothetical protein